MSDERRQFEREFPRRLIAKLRVGDDTCHLRLVDTSDGGAGLFAAETGPLTEGTVVEVTIDNEPPQQGVIRYIQSHPYGGFHVGVEWVDPENPK